MKLTETRKTALGITHQGEDVPDDMVLTAVDSLAARVANATAIVDAERAEVLRLATLAEGDKDGKLASVLQDMIAKADASQLPGFKTLYAGKAAAKYTRTCQKCGSTEIQERSSVEAPATATQQAKVVDTSIL